MELVFTRRFRLSSVLIREDFPTFERPEKAISGRVAGGYCDESAALVTKLVEVIIIPNHLRKSPGSLVKSPYCSLNDHLSQNAQSRSQMTFCETVKLE